MAQTIEFPVPALGERNDMPDNEVPIGAMRVCQNMYRNNKGRLQIRPGYKIATASTNPGGRIMGIHHFRTAVADEIVVAANLTGVWSYAGGAWTDITLGGGALTGTARNHVRFMTFGVSGTYKVVIVNGVDTPKIWNGSAAAYSTLGGSPGIAIDGAVAANRLLILVAPDLIKISDFNNPEVWPSGAGFNVRLIDSGDLLVGMERLNRTSVAIFGEESQWVARAQAGGSPFRFERIAERPGPLSAAAIVGVGGTIYYLAEDYNIYKFDGSTCAPVGFAMWPFIRESIDVGNRRQAHGMFMEGLNKIFFFFTESGATSPGLGVFYDVTTGEMGRLRFSGITASAHIRIASGVTWDSLTAYTWDSLGTDYPTWDSFGEIDATRGNAVGDTLGNVHIVGKGDGSDNGNPIEAIWETPLKAYGGWAFNFVPESFDTFFRKSNTAITVEPSLGFTNTLMEDPEYVALDDFDLSIDARRSIDLSLVEEKRFVTLRHKVNSPSGQVEWQGGIMVGSEADIAKGPTQP